MSAWSIMALARKSVKAPGRSSNNGFPQRATSYRKTASGVERSLTSTSVESAPDRAEATLPMTE